MSEEPSPSWPFERAFVDDELIEGAWQPADELAEAIEQLESRHDDPRRALPAMVELFGRAGLLGLTVPEAHGGTFETVRSRALSLARERLGHASPLADLAFAMQALGSYPITFAGDEPLRAEWLHPVARGEVVAAFALTEPDAGSDLARIATEARADGDGYVLRGHKTFISNAGVAGLYTVVAVTDAEAAPKRRLSAFAVPGDAAGLRTAPMHVLGGHPIGDVYLQDVRVPASARIGAEGEGLAVALGTLHRLRPTVGAAAVGFAQRALDESVQHVQSREQFEGPLANLPVVRAHLADMACELEAARLLVYRAASAADQGARRPVVARTGSMAKLVATESAQRVIDRAVQLHGGRGVRADSAVARLYEDVRALRIYEGTNDVHKELIARELLRPAAS